MRLPERLQSAINFAFDFWDWWLSAIATESGRPNDPVAPGGARSATPRVERPAVAVIKTDMPSFGAVVIPAEDVFSSSLPALALPYSRAMAIALTDVSHRAPFLLADTELLLDENLANGDGRYWLVKRSRLADLLKRANSRYRDRLFVAPHGDERPVRLHPRSTRKMMHAHGPKEVSRVLPTAALLLAVFALVALPVTTIARLEWLKADLAARLDEQAPALRSAQAKISTMRRKRDAATALLQLKTDYIPRAGIWTETSRVLPDDVWLTQLAIRHGEAQMSGFADHPADLIALLDQSHLFRETRFSAPVSSIPGHGGQQFSLTAQVARHD